MTGAPKVPMPPVTPEMRAWCREHGHAVSPKGYVSKAGRVAYLAWQEAGRKDAGQ
jgi:hypothetical protein